MSAFDFFQAKSRLIIPHILFQKYCFMLNEQEIQVSKLHMLSDAH